ncbi:MAG: glycosyltransferase family 4 protein, partial [Chloroflexi bacterium]|nr:glycosyltransferase family 4 protein [Chloroflexota bacterium]
NTSSLPEVAGDAALLVPPDDVAGWQSALERVYHEPELVRELVERGLRQAERFSWRRCARTILDVIEELG